MSKQDQHFLTTFSIILGSLVLFTVLMFMLATYIHGKTEATHVMEEPRKLAQIEKNIAPIAMVNVKGAKKPKPAPKVMTEIPAAKTEPKPASKATVEKESPPAVVASTSADSGASGKAVYDQACVACHGVGVAGAPKVGDAAAWSARLSKGKATLYSNSINGINVMPAKGGQVNLSDDEVRFAVDYMIEQSQ
ncbi:MAG: cytochrome c5 family protein [Gammaproteobacteria bacterium]|nr:cytochrome c5 family protein [Gammaproteobacteria bacterium]